MRRLVTHLVDGLSAVLAFVFVFGVELLAMVVVVELVAAVLGFTCLGILAFLVLLLAAAGFDIGTLWDLETGSTRYPPVPALYVAGAAALVVVLETTRRLRHWYVSCREEERWPWTQVLRRSRPPMRRCLRAHPLACLITLVVVELPISVLLLVGALHRYDEAHVALIVDEATTRGLDLERAECMAEAMVDRYSPIDGIDTTTTDPSTQATHLEVATVRQMLSLSFLCRGIAGPGAIGCMVDELVVEKAVGTWDGPLDALFPFETGAMDRQRLERSLVSCGDG